MSTGVKVEKRVLLGDTATKVLLSIAQKEIELEAYNNYLKRKGYNGSAEKDWQVAEKTILDRLEEGQEFYENKLQEIVELVEELATAGNSSIMTKTLIGSFDTMIQRLEKLHVEPVVKHKK